VDPNRDGQVSLQEYMAFMISKETENVHSSEEIENAFRAITAHQDRAYVTKDELYAVSITFSHCATETSFPTRVC
jgi:spectrin alpha